MRAIYLLLTLLISYLPIKGQAIFSPEIVSGHRSITYLHTIKYNFSPRFSLNNLVLLDHAYGEDYNNIYFIRNLASYSFHPSFALQGGIGIKNPGSFALVNLLYHFHHKNFNLSYSAGGTYQKGWTLEQSLAVTYTPQLTAHTKAYFHLLAIINLDRHAYHRGIQQLKIGLMQKNTQYGFAANFDQFLKAIKTWENVGVFIKAKF